VAGAPYATVGANILQGAVYVFGEPGRGWASTSTFTAKLTASDGAARDQLGSSVAISVDGRTVVAGALRATVGANPHPGAVYVFGEPDMGWASTSTFTAKLTASDGAFNDDLGWSVAISGNGRTVVAGAVNATVGANSFQGAVYVFGVMQPPGGPARSATPSAAGSVAFPITATDSNGLTASPTYTLPVNPATLSATAVNFNATAAAPVSGTRSGSAQGGNAAAAARIESELAVTYHTKYTNTFLAGSGLDWFWDSYSKDTTNPQPGDLLD
jgi:hypothetical protein